MANIVIGGATFEISDYRFDYTPPRTTPKGATGDQLRILAFQQLHWRRLGRWDCSQLEGLSPDEAMNRMRAFLKQVSATGWLRHEYSPCMPDKSQVTAPNLHTKIRRELSAKIGFGQTDFASWMRQAFGRARNPDDFVQWLTLILPHRSFILYGAAVPIEVFLTPVGKGFSANAMLKLTLKSEAAYVAEKLDECSPPPKKLRMHLPLRSCPGNSVNTRQWALNVARVRAKRNPRMSRFMNLMRTY
ncbi:hypothetical protein [Pontivivens nitratireducens]|uniref:Uncharacterized protein n=1 Tax=Pontivivens nitratireducens TaxID=2758038 RepID=A0A6G7VJ56_9RHOB|nr:hypothetical protein [Pontibrevibacter nitratireducens]QIK39878.1 hypothetical protein G8E03_03315 [Pontibrevibacter nitratireducens]